MTTLKVLEAQFLVLYDKLDREYVKGQTVSERVKKPVISTLKLKTKN